MGHPRRHGRASAPTRDPIEPGTSIVVHAKAMLVLVEHTAPAAEVDHSVAASLAGDQRQPQPR